MIWHRRRGAINIGGADHIYVMHIKDVHSHNVGERGNLAGEQR